MASRISVRWLPLVVVLAIALYLCFRIMQPFLGVMLWAVVLGVVFAPVHARIERRIGHPGIAAAISALLVLITIVGPVTLITIAVIKEAQAVAATLSPDSEAWVKLNATLIEPMIKPLSRFVDVDAVRSPEFIREKLEALSGSLAIGTVGVVGGVLAAVAQLLLVVFTLFYLLRDRDSISRAAYDLLPLEERQLTTVLTRTREVIAASVSGVVLISGIQGLLGCFIFWALGLPSAVLWGVVMFFLSMIPMAGAFLVWAPAALYLLASGEWTRGIVLIVWGVLVVGSIDNVLSPKIVGQRVRMHELLIFFAVLGGIQIFGVLGLILGPVIVAVTLALISILRDVGDRPITTEVAVD
jgi:predicted PurR-regulated permease PerM